VRLLVLAALVSLACATPVSAQERIALGADAGVRRVPQPCWDTPGAICRWWHPEGRLTFGERLDLPLASTFARAPSGRIFAMVPALARHPAQLVVQPVSVGWRLVFTDDLGASWQGAGWPDRNLPAAAIAFDPAGGGLAVAVGPDGSVWSSVDEGLSWRRRRSATGVGFQRVWLRRQTVLIEDTQGALWLSRDGGFALTTFAPAGSSVTEEEGALVITEGARRTRIDESGAVRRL
jgi:hypothetical protein